MPGHGHRGRQGAMRELGQLASRRRRRRLLRTDFTVPFRDFQFPRGSLQPHHPHQHRRDKGRLVFHFHGARRLWVRAPGTGDFLTQRARMLAVEGLCHRFHDVAAARIRQEHPRPRQRLQRHPMPPGGSEKHQEHKHLAKSKQGWGHVQRATGAMEGVSISYAKEGKFVRAAV